MFIHRLSSIDHISELEKTYERTTGLKVLNVSSWHISESFRNVQLKHFCPPQIGNAFDYVYTYSIPVHIRQAILKKLGSVPEASTILISPNNTISIINVINLLKHHGINNVCIVNSLRSMRHGLSAVHRVSPPFHLSFYYYVDSEHINITRILKKLLQSNPS